MEQWRNIPGYEGIYQASNIGRIRSSPNKVTSNAKYTRRVWKTRVLKPKAEGRGDLRVSLWKDGKCKDFLVARLVAMAWCQGYGENMTVNHIDGNFLNNVSTNLEWVTRGENVRKGFEIGLYSNIQKRVQLSGEDGEILLFNSMAGASRYLGRSNGYLSNAIMKGHIVRDLRGQIFSSTLISNSDCGRT